MFHPEFPAPPKTAARDPLVRDNTRQELIALIAGELLFLAALLVIARI